MPPKQQQLKNTWGQNAPEGSTVTLTTPSGSQCEAIRTGLQGLVTAGVLGESDSLTSLVDAKHIRRVRGGKTGDGEEINVESLMRDPESFGKIIMVVDRAIPHIVTWPTVKLHFTDEPDGSTLRVPEDKRDQSTVYTDQVGLEDKMFLFNWAVGGTADMDRFRQQSGALVATVEHGDDVPRPTKRAPKRPR
jgi:hypothetical protein